MIASFNSPVLLGVLGALTGALVGGLSDNQGAGAAYLVTGGALGLIAALVRDRLQGARLARWARQAREQREKPDAERAPAAGYWGEVAYRIGRSFEAYERELSTERHRLSSFLAAIDASPNGVVLLSPSQEVVWCNRNAAIHFALDPTRDLGQPVTNIVRVPEFVQYLRAGDFELPVHFRGPRLGTRLQVTIRRHADGFLVLSQDVTERERAEQMRRDLVANASHELKTPLTVVAGFIETLQSMPVSASQAESLLPLMAEQTGRMQAIIEDLLTLAEIEGRPAPPADEWFDAGDIVNDAVRQAQSRHGIGRRITASIDMDIEIAGTRSELRIALDNLLANACRHTPAQTSVLVRLSVQPNRSLRLAVIDDGPGVAAEHLPRLAERFYRVDQGRSRESGGTGLGLTIVREVAQRLGGGLEIASVPGEGSSFSLLIPAARIRERAQAEAA